MTAQSIWCATCYDEGWLWDSTDSGSGVQVYCDCEHGARLKAEDETPRTPSPAANTATNKEADDV